MQFIVCYCNPKVGHRSQTDRINYAKSCGISTKYITSIIFVSEKCFAVVSRHKNKNLLKADNSLIRYCEN